ncbi:MAG: fatty acid desaturase CarF family protein [Myxococcota bacterium]
MVSIASTDTPLDVENRRPNLRKDQFDNMNDWLNAKVTDRIERARESGEEMSAELAWVAENDHTIYQNRFKPLVYAVLATIVVGIAWTPSVPALLFTLVALYFYIDFYSGVLHVVLDNPAFCNLPIVGVPCVEFQWHHTFAYDISSRKLTDVWGDLNPLLAMKAGVLFAILGPTRLALMVAGVGFFWAYVNQFAHRMSHAHSSTRPKWAQWLQRRHILIPPSVHQVHHKTYDTTFPVLSGLTRQPIEWLLKLVPNQWVWLTTFLLLTAFDLVLFTMVLETLPLF